MKRDWLVLAIVCLVLGPVISMIPGLLLGGPLGVESPFFRGCLMLGGIVGGLLFVLLCFLDVIVRYFKRR